MTRPKYEIVFFSFSYQLRFNLMSPRHKQSDPSIIKSSVIRLRVTEAEADLFRTKAAEAGCKSISEYIRSRCIGEDIVDTTTAISVKKHSAKE